MVKNEGLKLQRLLYEELGFYLCLRILALFVELFMKLFEACFSLYPHRTTMYSSTLKAAKAIKSNQIK